MHVCTHVCVCGRGEEGPTFDNKFMCVNIVWFDVV